MSKTIGQQIRMARKMAGLTQQEAAEKVGVSQMTIRRVEKNFRNPTVNTVKKVANAFGISCSSLFEDEQTETTVKVMTLNDYQKAAARTMNKKLYPEQQADHALHGMSGEIGEIHSIYQKSYQGHEIDTDHVKKELGDLLWFISEYCTAMRWTLEDVAQTNIDKLLARFPNGFEVEKSLHRKEGDI